MIYRIDRQNFLIHAVDYFSLDDITHMEYAIISAVIPNGGKVKNCVKLNELYPDSDTVIAYCDTKDKSILEKMYFTMLGEKSEDRETSSVSGLIYHAFINPLLHHVNVMILCDRDENDFISALCKYLKKFYSIEVIDLNQLFEKGSVGPIYIDRGKIKDKAVDIRKAALRDEVKSLASTRDGKVALISRMSTKKKLSELNKFGIKADKNDNLDAMLLEEWCREDGQWDE